MPNFPRIHVCRVQSCFVVDSEVVQKTTLILGNELVFDVPVGRIQLQKIVRNVFCCYFCIFERFGTKRAVLSARIVLEARKTYLFGDDS